MSYHGEWMLSVLLVEARPDAAEAWRAALPQLGARADHRMPADMAHHHTFDIDPDAGTVAYRHAPG